MPEKKKKNFFREPSPTKNMTKFEIKNHTYERKNHRTKTFFIFQILAIFQSLHSRAIQQHEQHWNFIETLCQQLWPYCHHANFSHAPAILLRLQLMEKTGFLELTKQEAKVILRKSRSIMKSRKTG